MVPSTQGSDRIPLHMAISEALKNQIEAGQYQPGDCLPSEYDLGESFGVSRTTIRRAIANLIQQGLVTTHQGKGIFVRGHHKISFSMAQPLMHFDTALKQQGYASRIHSLRSQRTPASAEIARKLQLPHPGSQVYWQEKIIYADTSPIALDITYFPEAVGEPLHSQLQEGFTYSTLTRNGITLNAAEVSLESIPATYELSEYLAVPLGIPLLVFNYLAYWEQRHPAVCGQTLSRSDWTCYTSQIEMGAPSR